jgi:transcriptional regulator with XRE-family HTH domain
MMVGEGPVSRLRNLLGLSLREFSKRYNISKPALTNYEAGMYPALSDAMVELLYDAVSEAGHSLPDLMREWYGVDSLYLAYSGWLRASRVAEADRFMVSPYTVAELSTRARDGRVAAPMLVFVEETAGSVYNFSKLLKVPQATVWRYVEGKTSGMPKQLSEALESIGYPRVSDLRAQQGLWRERYA